MVKGKINILNFNLFSKTTIFIRMLILTGTFLSVNIASAQHNWFLSARPGINFATKHLGDARLDAGFGFEGEVHYRFINHLYASAGWGWNQFFSKQSFAGPDVDFEETGYTFGLKLLHPFKNSNINYLIEGGGIYNHIEVENNKEDLIANSGRGLGWQAGIGLALMLDNRFYLMGGVKYRSLATDIAINNINTAMELNYISINTGLSWSF